MPLLGTVRDSDAISSLTELPLTIELVSTSVKSGFRAICEVLKLWLQTVPGVVTGSSIVAGEEHPDINETKATNNKQLGIVRCILISIRVSGWQQKTVPFPSLANLLSLARISIFVAAELPITSHPALVLRFSYQQQTVAPMPHLSPELLCHVDYVTRVIQQRSNRTARMPAWPISALV